MTKRRTNQLHTCRQGCKREFTSAQGRALHERRAHGDLQGSTVGHPKAAQGAAKTHRPKKQSQTPMRIDEPAPAPVLSAADYSGAIGTLEQGLQQNRLRQELVSRKVAELKAFQRELDTLEAEAQLLSESLQKAKELHSAGTFPPASDLPAVGSPKPQGMHA